MKQSFLETIRSAANGPALGKHLNTVIKKRWLRIAGIAVAVLLVILVALPFLINVNSFRPKIESEASSALGRQVTVGNLSLSILSGSVGADNIAILDDPAFSKSPFITAKSLKVGVELMLLIFSKQLKVTEITLEQPQITLLKGANGTWNFSSLGGGIGEQGTSFHADQVSASGSFSRQTERQQWQAGGGKIEFFRQAPGLRQSQYQRDEFLCYFAVPVQIYGAIARRGRRGHLGESRPNQCAGRG